MFVRLHNLFLPHVLSFHGADVHQTLFIDFARWGTPTKKELCKIGPVSSLVIKYKF